jgi:AcrR family transcriptional regulator
VTSEAGTETDPALEDSARGASSRGGAATRELILRAAAVMFTERGYAQTTIRDLAAAVGIRGPSLYNHFNTKEDVLFAVCEDSIGRLLAAVSSVDRDADGDEALQQLIRAHLETILEDSTPYQAMMIEIRSLSPERRAIILGRRDDYQGQVEAIIARAQHAGIVRGDRPARHLMRALLNLLTWTMIWFEREPGISTREVVSLMTTVYLDGVREPEAGRDWAPIQRLRAAMGRNPGSSARRRL